MGQVRPAYERFVEKIAPPDANGCRLWNASDNKNGYGMFAAGGRGSKIGAHVYAYVLTYGPIPEGHEVHHTCGQRRCVEPSHLVARTRAEHNALHHRKDSATCVAGHPWTPENTYVAGYTIGGRPMKRCRKCRSISQAARDRARRAKTTA